VIGVAPVIDVQHDDASLLFVDAIANAVLTASGSPKPLKWFP